MTRGIILLIGWMTIFGADQKGLATVETTVAKITISTKKVGSYETGCAAALCKVYVRIENVTEAPLDPDLSKAYLRTDGGKSLRSMTADEGTRALAEALTSGKLGFAAGIFGVHDPQQVERQFGGRYSKQWLAPGPIPEKSYREGILFFEGSGKAKPSGLRLFIPGVFAESVELVW